MKLSKGEKSHGRIANTDLVNIIKFLGHRQTAQQRKEAYFIF